MWSVPCSCPWVHVPILHTKVFFGIPHLRAHTHQVFHASGPLLMLSSLLGMPSYPSTLSLSLMLIHHFQDSSRNTHYTTYCYLNKLSKLSLSPPSCVKMVLTKIPMLIQLHAVYRKLSLDVRTCINWKWKNEVYLMQIITRREQRGNSNVRPSLSWKPL
jgi:hypothetical protein